MIDGSGPDINSTHGSFVTASRASTRRLSGSLRYGSHVMKLSVTNFSFFLFSFFKVYSGLSVRTSLSLSLCVSLCFSLSLSVCLSLSVSLSLSLSLSVCLSLNLVDDCYDLTVVMPCLACCWVSAMGHQGRRKLGPPLPRISNY